MTDITVSRAPFLCGDDSHGVKFDEYYVTFLVGYDVMYGDFESSTACPQGGGCGQFVYTKVL